MGSAVRARRTASGREIQGQKHLGRVRQVADGPAHGQGPVPDQAGHGEHPGSEEGGGIAVDVDHGEVVAAVEVDVAELPGVVDGASGERRGFTKSVTST